MKRSIICSILLSLVFAPTVFAQAGGYIPSQLGPIPLGPTSLDRSILDLDVEQRRARSNIAENRVTRQAEVSRLESRIDAIEERLDQSLSGRTGSTAFEMLSLFDAMGDASWAGKRADMLKVIVEDYRLGLEIDLAQAKISSIRTLDAVRSLDQLAARGLASVPQLELERLKHQQNSLKVTRLEKLIAVFKEMAPLTTNDAQSNDAQLEVESSSRE